MTRVLLLLAAAGALDASRRRVVLAGPSAAAVGALRPAAAEVQQQMRTSGDIGSYQEATGMMSSNLGGQNWLKQKGAKKKNWSSWMEAIMLHCSLIRHRPYSPESVQMLSVTCRRDWLVKSCVTRLSVIAERTRVRWLSALANTSVY